MSNKIKSIVIIGSDARQTSVFSELCGEGYKCCLFGNLQAFSKEELFAKIEKADVLILPLPSRTSDGFLNCTFNFFSKINMIEILLHVNKKCLVIGSRFSGTEIRLCKSKKIKYIDIYANVDFVLANTKISAEGALFELMLVLDMMLGEATVGIVGYGRLGSELAKLLRGFGTKVCVMARREESLFEAAAIGCETKLIKKGANGYILEIPDCSFDAFFNTVEHTLFTEATQQYIKDSPVFFELASAKGGYSKEFANNKNYRMIYPGSLPLRYAPKTAANEYSNCIKQIIKKGGKAQI